MKYILKEIADIISGGTPKTSVPDYWGGSIPWISIKDFNFGNIYINQTEKSITQLGLENSSTNILKSNDIIISARGTVGCLALINKEMAFNQSCYGIRVKDETQINPKYLYWYLKNIMNELKAKTHGSVFDTIIKTDLENLEINVPDIKTQDKISTIIDNITKKIISNDQINNNLYKFSNYIFKEWFVEFKYPGFNGKTKNSELGEIPDNWEIGFFDDSILTSIIKSGVNKYYGQKKYVATADVSGTNITNYEYVNYTKKPSRANMTPKTSSVWFAKMENSVKNIVVDYYMNDILENYIFSTGFMGIECLNNSLYYIWCLINDDKFLQDKNSLSTGTLMAGISNSTIKNYKYLIPDQETLHNFNTIELSINKLIYNNNSENERLSQLRNALLPKLMNGEIDLDNIEI